MVRLLQSGKFWLRFAVFGSLAAAAVALGLHFLLLQLFDARRIQTLADDAVRGSGRTVRFGADIGRSWLPRPTVTLRHVSLSRPGSSADALHVGEMRIGLAWRSLWNGPEIEKWVWKNAEAEITRHADGSWNVHDLWRRQNAGTVRVNRLIVENSRINLHLPEGSYLTSRFYLNTEQADTGRPFRIGGHTRRSGGVPFVWSAAGTAQQAGAQWRLPALHVEADVPFQKEHTKIAADADVEWQPQNLQARNFVLRADSSYRRLHLTARSPVVVWKPGHVKIAEAGGVFTAGGENDGRWDGTLSLEHANLHHNAATVGKLDLNSSYRHNGLQTTFIASAPLLWRKGRTLESDTLRLATHQSQTGAAAAPRFTSRLEGSFSLNGNLDWQAALKGLFDRQPVSLEAAYTAARNGKPAKLAAAVDLHKLSLSPYWQSLQAQNGAPYPAFLTNTRMPETEARIRIGSLIMPGFQMDEISTLLYADGRRIALTGFRAGLYGGQTEGGLSIANTDPPAFRLQQNAQNVQIRPLLQDLLGYHSISGTGNAVIDLSARGNNRSSLTRTLNGSLQLNVADGTWLGIDVNNILHSLRSHSAVGSGGHNPQTPFSRFSLNSEIRNGIGSHSGTELLSDSLIITSSGQTDLNTRTVSENVLIRHAAKPDAKPVPLKISGPADNPSVTLDFNRLTSGLATPEEKQRALAETLREQWQWLNTMPPAR